MEKKKSIKDYPLYGKTGVKDDSKNNFSYLLREARKREKRSLKK